MRLSDHNPLVPVANGRILASSDARLLTIDDGHLFRAPAPVVRGNDRGIPDLIAS